MDTGTATPQPHNAGAAGATEAVPAAAPPDSVIEAEPPAATAHGDVPKYSLPRGVVILLGLAAGVIVCAAIRAVPTIVGPIFLALVLTITVAPLRSMLIRHGAPRWLATLAVVVGVYAIVIGLFVAAVVGMAQFAGLMPEYADEIQQQLSGLKTWMSGLGVSSTDVDVMLQNIDSGSIVAFVTGILSSVADVMSSLLFVITLLLFMAVDGSVFDQRMIRVRAGREPVLSALHVFAAGTRKYFAVATIFGGIVAAIDLVALIVLGIPAAGLWALLAFVTNYVPNVGFIIGMVPPAVLALLTGGVGKMITLIVVYCVVNFVIQSVLQPKFVGDAVGLTTTVSFLSLVIWAYLLGPLGAVLAIPASLLVKALLVDVDPDARWLQLFLGDAPVLEKRKRKAIEPAPDSLR